MTDAHQPRSKKFWLFGLTIFLVGLIVLIAALIYQQNHRPQNYGALMKASATIDRTR